MADISTGQLEEIFRLLNSAEDLEKLKKYLQDLDPSKLHDLAEVARITGVNFERLAINAESVNVKLAGIERGISPFKKLNDVLDSLSSNFGSTALTVASFIEPLIGILPRAADSFGSLGKAGELAGAQASRSFENLHTVLGAVGSVMGLPADLMAKAEKGFGNIMGDMDRSRNAERGLLSMAAATGQLSEFMKRAGDDFRNLSNLNGEFAQNAFLAAQATGASVAQSSEYATMMQRTLPGSLQRTIEVSGPWGGILTEQVALMKVAGGVGISFGEALNSVEFAQVTLGASVEKSLQYLVGMYTVADQLGMRMDILKGYTVDAAGAFKFFGDNTQSSLNVIEAIGPALQNAGLGQRAVADLVRGATTSLAQMDVGRKAFISGQAGGPGGLAGAFEIDRLMMQGRMDEVMKMTMQAMERSFGRKAITSEDVQRSPELAGEFQKQISYLTDVAKVAGSSIEAQQLLGAMSTGAFEKIGDITQTPEEKVAEAVDRGNAIQERHFTALDSISNQMERLTMFAAIQTQAVLHEAGGKLGINTKEGMQAAAKRTAELVGASTQGGEGYSLEQGREEAVAGAGSAAKSAWEFSKMLMDMVGIRGTEPPKSEEIVEPEYTPEMEPGATAPVAMTSMPTAPPRAALAMSAAPRAQTALAPEPSAKGGGISPQNIQVSVQFEELPIRLESDTFDTHIETKATVVAKAVVAEYRSEETQQMATGASVA